MDSEQFIIQPGSPEPIYRQIAQQLRRLIASGRLAAGEEIPSVRDVAGRHAINPMTVSRAYGQLELEGLLERRRGKGMVVAPLRGRAQSADRRLQQVLPLLDELSRQGRELGLPLESIIERLRALWEMQK